MPATPRVAVVIPNWNGAALLPIVLDSLERQTFRDFVTLVVDNASTDASLSVLEGYPDVRVIPRERNEGFSRAVNAGIRASATAQVAVVNNDVELHAEWLATMVAALDARPDAGFAASRICRFDDRATIDSAGDVIRVTARQRGWGEPDGEAFAQPCEVATACAAAALYRRELFESAGLFNEEFFAYSEDVELGLRAQRLGFRCVYVPDARAFHMTGATSRRIPGRIVYLQVRNAFSVFVTMYPVSYALRYLPRFVAATLWYTLLRGRPGAAIRALAVTGVRLPLLVWRRLRLPRVRGAEHRRRYRSLFQPPPALDAGRLRERWRMRGGWGAEMDSSVASGGAS